nr:unnamed protein product [Callosobruchus chinensis]
MPSSGSK